MRIGDRKPRNGRCKNAVCACTGACMEDSVIDKRLVFTERRIDVQVERIFNKSDEETWQDAIKEFGSEEAAKAEAERIRKIIEDAVSKALNKKKPNLTTAT